MKILIGYDGSECSDDMLVDLRRAGLPKVADVKIVSVGELWLAPPSDDENSPLFDIETPRKLSAHAHGQIATAFPDWNIIPEGEVGSPSLQLLSVADTWKPDLIVVGSHGRSKLERIFFGSVSQRIVTEAHCSVRVSRKPRTADPEAAVRIIIGLDDSPEAKAAVDAVARRAWPEGSEAILVTSIDPYAVDSTDTGLEAQEIGVNVVVPKTRNHYRYAQSLQAPAEQQLKDAGLKVGTVISDESPKKSILHTAEHAQADSIFVGSRGLGRLRRLLLGSVSSAVVSRAHCSVEVVRLHD